MRLRTCPIVSLVFFLVWGLVYSVDRSLYVDASAPSGGSGETESSPYRALAQIDWALIRTWIAAGDSVTINLRRSQLWREELTVNASGTADRPLVIQPYGTGAKPVITGSADFNGGQIWQQSKTRPGEFYLASAGTGLPQVVEPSAVWLDGVAARRGVCGQLAGAQWAWGDNDSLGRKTLYLGLNPEQHSVEGSVRPKCVYLLRQSHVILRELELRQNGQIIAGSYTYNSATLEIFDSNYITAEDCDIHDSGGLLGNVYLIRSSHNIFKRCKIHTHLDSSGNGYGCLVFMESSDQGRSDYNTISECTIYETRAEGGDCIGNVGTWIANQVYGGSHNVFEFNEIYGPAANAIYNRTGSSDNVIRFNYIHNIRSVTGRGGIAVQLRDQANRNRVHGNIVSDCLGPTMQSDGQNGGPGSIDPSCSDNKFWNNTIYNGSTPGANGFHFFGKNTGLEVINNIVVSNSGDVILIGASTSDHTHDGVSLHNNRYYKTVETGYRFVYRGKNYATLSEFTAAMNADGYTSDSTCTDGDPLLVTTPPSQREHFALDSHSPCIGAGALIPEIHTQPDCDVPDIGAVPYLQVTDLRPSQLRTTSK